jgi:ABC-2 type transport system permease protein
MVMMLRLCADPRLPLLETLASIAVMAASVPAAIWAAGKIFRTGALMYGKRPSLREIFRWLRES